MKRYLLQCAAILAVLGLFPAAGALIEGTLPVPAALAILVLLGLAARRASYLARRTQRRAEAARVVRLHQQAARPAETKTVSAPFCSAASHKTRRPALRSA